MRIFPTILAIVGILSGTSSCAPADSGGAAAAAAMYTVLDEQGTQLRDDFNRHAGSVRLLFVVDPVCGGCLRGLDDVNRDLLATTSDERLETFVVHVPIIGGKAKNVEPASALLHNERVHHYWNPSGAFGRELAEAVGMKGGDRLVYAWDVWLIYGPEARWDRASPPRPARLMHQLNGLEDHPEFPPLDSKALGQEVRALLTQLPPSSPTPSAAEQTR
jgi:hypothetical protein